MENLFAIFVFIISVGVFIIPLVILVKVLSISSRVGNLERLMKLIIKTNQSEPVVEKKIDAVTETLINQTPKPVIEEEVITQTPVVEDIPPVVEDLPPVVEDLPPVVEDLPPVVETTPPVIEYIPAANKNIPVFVEERISEEEPSPVHFETVINKGFPAIRYENLLSKIGIVTLVLGIAFFVKYAIDKDWINEVGRVAIGLLTGGVLIGIAHRLRKKYGLFAALMVGGGISALYITITLAFREYHLFGQPLAFGILIAITIFSVILSLLYERKELALFSLLGGYASPLLVSTGAGNYVVLFSFILILNTGMLLISMRKEWKVIGIVSFVCTVLFFWWWLLNSFEAQYTGATTFAVLFFAQFYLLAVFDHLQSRRKISPFQVAVILSNNLSAFAALIFIFNHSPWKVQGLITIALAVVNAVVMTVLFRNVRVDKRLLYLIIAIVLSFVSLAVPVQLNGHVITMFWAAEMVILLWLWHKSAIKVFYFGFVLIFILTVISYMMDMNLNYLISGNDLPVVFNRIFITGCVVVAACVVSRQMLVRLGDQAKSLIDVQVMRRFLTGSVILVSFLTPWMEICYQFGSSESGISHFTGMVLTVYATVYAAVLTVIYRKKLSQIPQIVGVAGAFIVAYLVVGLPIILNLREVVFSQGQHETLFLLHYISLFAMAVIFYLIIKSMKSFSGRVYRFTGWGLVVSAVVALSVELECILIQLFSTPLTYSTILYDVRTFGYPILWGVLALVLMIWGLKAKEVLLRQISLGFFAFIILKFYVSDIWLMSPSGRIISFVVLGIILLVVSFMIQKIKNLIKDDDKKSPNENIK